MKIINKAKINLKKEKKSFTHKSEKNFGPGFALRRSGKAGI